MDIKDAFLNVDLQEVYMVPLFGVAHNLREVYKLKKALYGLKQALCAWFAKFSNVLTSLSFHPNHHDLALFLKCTTTSRILYSLYVDNTIIIGDDVDEIAMLKLDLASRL